MTHSRTDKDKRDEGSRVNNQNGIEIQEQTHVYTDTKTGQRHQRRTQWEKETVKGKSENAIIVVTTSTSFALFCRPHLDIHWTPPCRGQN